MYINFNLCPYIVLLLFYQVLRGLEFGGAKRPRVSISDLRAKPDDLPAIQGIFGMQSFNTKGWLDAMNDAEQISQYSKAVEGEKNFDRIKKLTLDNLQNYIQMKDAI